MTRSPSNSARLIDQGAHKTGGRPPNILIIAMCKFEHELLELIGRHRRNPQSDQLISFGRADGHVTTLRRAAAVPRGLRPGLLPGLRVGEPPT